MAKELEYIAISMAILSIVLTNLSSAEMPDNFYAAQNNGGSLDAVTVKNYEAGASFTEAYYDFKHLERNTDVRTGSHGREENPANAGFLEASISSSVIGKAHIAWRSADPTPGPKGRHSEWGRSTEDLVGVFSIERFVQLWENSTCGEISVDWLPCI